MALGFNDRFEPFLRRHHGLKRRLRAAYYAVNGRPMPGGVSDAERMMLTARYADANARLADQLTALGIDRFPSWLPG